MRQRNMQAAPGNLFGGAESNQAPAPTAQTPRFDDEAPPVRGMPAPATPNALGVIPPRPRGVAAPVQQGIGRKIDPSRMTRAQNVTPPEGLTDPAARPAIDEAVRSPALGGVGLPTGYNAQGQADFNREVAYPVLNRLNEAQTAINRPNYVEFPPPGGESRMTEVGPVGGSFVVDIRQNEDGTSDYLLADDTEAPRTRVEEASTLQRLGRGLGQLLGIGLETTGLPAKAVERGLGAITPAVVNGPVTLPNGFAYTPPASPQRTGFTSPTVTAATPRPQTVEQILRAAYPDNEMVDTALRDVTRIAYSGGEAQLRAAARIIEYGQLPDKALYGDGAYVLDVLAPLGWADDAWGAIQADPLAKWVADGLIAKGQTQAEVIDTFATAGLPGEENLAAELVGQVLLDPLNAVGAPVQNLIDARRAANAGRWFLPSTRTLGEIVDGLRRTARPLGNVIDNILPVRTPTAVRNQMVELAGDALSFVLTTGQKAAGAADPLTGKGRPLLTTVLKALTDLSDEAPDVADTVRYAAWQTTQANARRILAAYPAALSDAGRLAGALVRELAQSKAGRVSTESLESLLGSGGSPYEIVTRLMPRLQQAAESMLTPARQGARGVAEFVEFTGKRAQDFPIFERGLAGATERINVRRAAANAAASAPDAATRELLKYDVDAGTLLLHGFDTARTAINSGLWHVFATFSPAYAARNFANNLTTALVDGNLSLAGNKAVDAWIDGLPALGATRGVTSSATKGVDVIGSQPRFSASALSNTIEQWFSKRIYYAASKRYLDRVMRAGQAIPDLPPSLRSALGDDIALGLADHIARTYGDVDGAINLLKRQGVMEVWRVTPEARAGELAEFDPALRDKVAELLNNAPDQAAFRAGIADLRRETLEKLDIAEENLPPVSAFQGEQAEAYSRDLEVAREMETADVPGAAPLDFEQQLVLDRNRVETARGVAEDALRRVARSDPASSSRQIDAFLEAQSEVGRLARRTTEQHDALREAVKAASAKYRSMPKLTPKARGRILDDLWAKYFADRDALWQTFRRSAVERYHRYSTSLGVGFEPVTEAAARPVAEAVETAAEQAAPVTPPVSTGRRVNTDDLYKRSRTELPPDLSNAYRDQAQAMLNELNAGEPGERIILGSGVDERVISAGSSYPDWYGDLSEKYKPNIRTVRNQLQAIIDGKKDTTATARRLKEYIWQRLQVTDPLTGTPPEPEVLRLLGRTDEAERAAAKWAEAGVTPTIRPGGLEYPAPAVQATPPASVAPNVPSEPVMPVPEGPPTRIVTEGVPGTPVTFGRVGDGPPAPGGAGAPELLQLGGTPPPIPDRWTPADPRSILSTLRQIESEVLGKWGRTKPVNLTDEQVQLLADWAEAARGSVGEARLLAGQVGLEARNFALLNYGDRRNFDQALGVVFPYQYWYGRTYGNWLKRVAYNPAAIANYGRYRVALEKMHAALPEYQRQQLSTEDLGIEMDVPLMFNLEQTLSPLYGLLGADFTNPERRRAGGGAGGVMEDLSGFGPSMWAPIVWGLALNAAANGDSAAVEALMNNYLGTLPRTVRAVTAKINEMGGTPDGPFAPGGVNLDPQMLAAAGLSALAGGDVKQGMGETTTPWEQNRIAQILTSYWDTPDPGADPNAWQAQLVDQAYYQRGPLWERATQQMFAETSTPVLVSYLFGLGFKPRQEYETEIAAIWSEVAAIRRQAADKTPEEMQQLYLDLERRHPMYDLLMLSRADGPERDDAWVWEAMGRVGPANREMWEQAGVSDEALDTFYRLKGTAGMNPVLLRELLDGASALNAVLRPRTPEEAQRQLDAKNEWLSIQDDLEAAQPAEAFELEQEYYQVRDVNGPDAASAWLDNLSPARQGLLYGLWDDKQARLAQADPLTQRYYSDPERYRQYLIGQYYQEQEELAPGVRELNTDYWALRDRGEFAAATLLLEENPQLETYWDNGDAFWGGELNAQIRSWLATLPQVDQGAMREDVDPQGLAQNELYQLSQEQAAEFAGAGLDGEDGDGQAREGNLTRQDEYIAKVEAERQAKLDDQGYLNADNRLAFGDSIIQPLIDTLGGVGAAGAFEQPIAQDWPILAAGVPGLLAMVGEAESVREGLMLYAGDTGNANWVRYVALLRSLSDEELSGLAKKYPQLADAALVAQQAREYELPSYLALADILGFTVSFREDGTYGITRQTAKKKDKDEGGGYTFDLESPTFGSNGGGGVSRGGAAGGGARSGGAAAGRPARYSVPPRNLFERMVGGRRSGGGRDEPDAAAEAVGSWVSFAAQMKLDQPQLLDMLMEYFDMPDQTRQQALLQRYPALLAYLQGLDGAKLAQLFQWYQLWRGSLAEVEDERRSNARAQTRITRVYPQRQAESGLN